VTHAQVLRRGEDIHCVGLLRVCQTHNHKESDEEHDNRDDYDTEVYASSFEN